MKNGIIILIATILVVSKAQAVEIGFFTDLDELIKKADAIVILRVDHHVDMKSSPTLYTTHDCYIYQTLKGKIPTDKVIRLQLMDTRSPGFSTPFSLFSTHLMFLTKKRSPGESTDFRTIEISGANVCLSAIGHEKVPKGKTVSAKIRSVLKRAVDQNKKKYEEEQAFLKRMINGTAKQKPAPASKGQ